MAKYYDWGRTFSYQTGTQGEMCLVVGAKNIGKTFGLRLALLNRCISKGLRFVEVSRTKEESRMVSSGYLDKLQAEGFFRDYSYRVEGGSGILTHERSERELDLISFVSLTEFQSAKRRTYLPSWLYIFDEAILDRDDRHHHYLPNEYFTLAKVIDSITREQYDRPMPVRCYLLGNPCDLTAPYFRYCGVRSVPDYGYSWHNNKNTLLHFVRPWATEERRVNTFVGRMLAGHAEESGQVFDNQFITGRSYEYVAPKSQRAKFQYGLVFNGESFGIWGDFDEDLFYVTRKCPKDGRVYALTKRDMSIDYTLVDRAHSSLKVLIDLHFKQLLRFEDLALQDSFMRMLTFYGVV